LSLYYYLLGEFSQVMNIIPPVPDLGQMRPLALALKEVDFVAHSHRLSTLSLCLESLWNRTLSKGKHLQTIPIHIFVWCSQLLSK